MLQKIYAEQDVATDPTNDGGERRSCRRKLVGDLAWQDGLRTRWTLAENLLRAGDSAGAVKQLETIRKRCNELSVRRGPNSEQQLSELLALSLRLGEQENCAAHHPQNSCIFPITGSGVPIEKREAQGQ